GARAHQRRGAGHGLGFGTGAGTAAAPGLGTSAGLCLRARRLYSWPRRDAVRERPIARSLAAIIGAPLAAFSIGAALVAFLPVSDELAFAIGSQSMLPLWVAFACVLPLCRSGRGALGASLGVSGLLLASLWLRSGL